MASRLRVTVPVALLWMPLTILSAQSQPPDNREAPLLTLTLEQLGSVEVTTVSKQPEEFWRTAAAVFVLTQEEIRRSGASTLPELLRLVPGVQVSRLDTGHWAVGIRGFVDQFSKSMLVLIDGRSVYTPLFAGVYWQVHDTLLADIDRIEIIRGPGGTIWGANAVNGVINIITKHARDTQGTYASASTGNVDHGIAGLRYGAAVGDDLFYRVYAKGSARGPQFHTDQQPYDEMRLGQAGFRMDWSRPAGDTVALQGDIYRGRAGDRVDISTFFPPGTTTVESNDQVAGGNVQVTWRRDRVNGSGYQLKGYYDRTSRTAAHFGETRNTFDVDFVHRLPLPRQALTWGLGARSSAGDFEQMIPTLGLADEDRTDHLFSVFAQDEIALVPDTLDLTVGSKFERNSYTGFEIQPNIRLVWRTGPRQTLWGALTRAVRIPSRLDRELELTAFGALTPLIYLSVVGNDEFKSERLIGTEVGYRRVLAPGLSILLSAFHNDYTDLAAAGPFAVSVETTPLPHMLVTVPFVNGIEGSSDGVEVVPEWLPTESWRLRSSYSYLRVNARNLAGNMDAQSVVKYEGSSPRHQVVVQSSFNLPQGLEFDQTYRYVSALPAQAVDGYKTVDLRMGWRMTNRLFLSLVGRDLLESHHAEFSKDAGPTVEIKRSVAFMVTWAN